MSNNVRLNTTHFFIKKIPNGQELQQIDFKDFLKLYKKYTTKASSVLVIDTTISTDNPLHFQKNLLEEV